MNANELTALISECLREIDDHEFFLKLESVLRQQQAEIDALRKEREGMCVFCENRMLSNRQHQGLKWKRYDWRNIALTMLIFVAIVLSYAVITGVCK